MEKYNRKEPGKISGILFIVLAMAGLWKVGSAIPAMIQILGESYIQEHRSLKYQLYFDLVVWIFLFCLLLVLLIRGFWQLRRISWFHQIQAAVGARELIALEDLAKEMGWSLERTRKVVGGMIQKNFFLQGHLNQEYTYLIVTDQKYKEYLEVIKSWREEKKRWEDLGFDQEKRRTIQRASQCLKKIQEAVDQIQDKELTDDLVIMERGIEKLVTTCRNAPENMSELGTFLNYYLPLAEKLTQEYLQIQKYEMTGENLDSLREDLPRGLRELAGIFDKIAERLCDQMEMDISRDITILEAVMAENSLMKGK